MKYDRVISTAVLLLLFGTTIPAFAQKDEEKGGGKPQAAQHEQQPQHAQKAQPQQRAVKAQPQERAEHAQPQQHAQRAQPQQRAEKVQPQQRAEKVQPQGARQSRGQQQQTVAYNGGNSSNHGNGNNGNHYGRISDASYHSHFGHEHSFHMGHPEMRGGYNRFQYGGYSFGYNQGWPEGWGYNDDFYVEYIDGAYFLSDLRFPGVQITLNIF
jgi:hypothetical protein